MTDPPRKPRARQPRDDEPGPNQGAINREQGRVNARQSDLNDELVAEDQEQRRSAGRRRDERADESDARADESEAQAAKAGKRRDAEHVASEERQDVAEARADRSGARADKAEARADVSGERADKAEARADRSGVRADEAEALEARTTKRRDAQHVAQGETNADQAQTNADQAQTNIDAEARRDEDQRGQRAINEAAVETLREVGVAAKEVTDLLRANVKRGRSWTMALAGVVAVIVLLGVLGAWRFQVVTDDAETQRAALVEQTARLKAQTAAIAAQATDVAATRVTSCAATTKRTNAIKDELTFLVGYAIGDHNKSAKLRQFKANYPAHLRRVIPAVDCTP